MIQDDEYEELVTTPERIQALGFKPQKEILTNHMLPYGSKLDEESTKFLSQVRTNLAKSVMLREMKPGCGVWSARLMKYIRIYGLKFSKEDHIAFIKLAYELIIIPDLEPCKIHKFATLFIMLTKKRHLISPEELTLPWRPLYDVGKKIFDKNATHVGMYHYFTPDKNKKGTSPAPRLSDALSLFGLAEKDDNELPTSLEGSYMSMVKCARPYFEVEATKEILETILPNICPWSSDTHEICQLATFLPVALYPQYAAQGHQLWFDSLMDLWETCYNAQCGVSELMMVFSGLAKRNPGAIDWSPYAPSMFMKFLHALNLPVAYKDMNYSKNHSLDIKNIASWIVWSICPDGVILKQLRSFLAGVESYLHSANAGRWSYKLRDLLRKLAREFLNRVRREREDTYAKSWENKTPDAYKLRDDDINEFVNIVLEPTLQAVYSRSGALDISIALQNLATLRPATVIPPLLERLKTSLTSLTEPHRVTAAMSAVAAVARPMLRGADGDYPEGPMNVVPILLAVLPGLDPNDIKKTLVTLHFILMFSWMVPYIDCSNASDHWPDLTEEELLICESTAQFEDFVLVFLDRVFTIIESSVMEHVRLDTKEFDSVRSKTDAVMETSISSASLSVLMQCSPKIFREALRKFAAFATQSTFETNVSGSMVGVLLRVFARIDPKATLAAFVPKLCGDLLELLATEESIRDENPPRDLVYRLVLLMHVVECDGAEVHKYVPQILPVLDRALKLHSVYALTRACEVLSHIFMSLSCLDLKEWRSSPNDYGEAPEKWLPIRDWGRGCLLKDANFKWHVPSEAEAACAQLLVDRYMVPEVARLRKWLNRERNITKERRLRCLHIINAVFSCNSFLPPPNEKPVMLMESEVPATTIPFTTGVNFEVRLNGQNMRIAVTDLLLGVQAQLLADKSDDTRGLEMLIQVWERVVVLKGTRNGAGLEARLRSYGALERPLDGRGGVSGDKAGAARLRMLVADATKLQDESRWDMVCDAGIAPSVLKALHALYELSIHTYSSVRILAQIRLYWMLSHYPYSYRALVPKLSVLLAQGGEGDEWHARHKGALYIMLGPRAAPLVTKQDWDVVSVLWSAVLRAPLSEKPSILRLEQAFSDTLHRHFPAVNTQLKMSQSAIDAASYFLKDELKDPEFQSLLEQSEDTEFKYWKHSQNQYRMFIDDLVDIAETPNLQWRRLELTMQMLLYTPSVQTNYTPRAVELIVRSLIHDDIAVRKTALRLTHYVLKQRKRPLKKISLDLYEVAGIAKPTKFVPGYRKDLEWAIYSEDRFPKTEEEWNKPWLRNPINGFYAWPLRIVVAAPTSEQVFSSNISPEDMEDGERHIYEFFTDEASVNKLVSFLTVEEKKGKDKFNGTRFSVFRLLFSQFGEAVSTQFAKHAARCAADATEAPQRFAAEVAAALMRAPRYWSKQRSEDMYKSVLEILNNAFTAVTPETMEDWGTCLATGVEKASPNRIGMVLHWLLDMCVPKKQQHDSDASFLVCARLYALQGALGSLTWRAAPIAKEILRLLEEADFIQHPYQNVRETVGSILMTIFDTDLMFPGGRVEDSPAPHLADFLADLRPKLAALYDENGDIIIKSGVSTSGGGMTPCADADCTMLSEEIGHARVPVDAAALPLASREVRDAQTPSSSSAPPSPPPRASPPARRLPPALRLAGDAPAPSDHARAQNLLATVLRGCMGITVRGIYSSTSTQYSLVATACGAASRGQPQPHAELPRAAAGFLATAATASYGPGDMPTALRVLEGLASGKSWWARLASLDFAQPLLFYSLPLLCAEPEYAVRAEAFARNLMRDSRLEVRQLAAKLLTGLMHCRALPDEDKTIRSLMKSCRSKELLERHCGVLGLCSYLASRPYSLGPKLGTVLTELSRHTSAPDPIPATIRTALADFRRTHLDDWAKHREQLTEDELDLLADLTAPPSYCA